MKRSAAPIEESAGKIAEDVEHPGEGGAAVESDALQQQQQQQKQQQQQQQQQTMSLPVDAAVFVPGGMRLVTPAPASALKAAAAGHRGGGGGGGGDGDGDGDDGDGDGDGDGGGDGGVLDGADGGSALVETSDSSR